MTSREKEVIEMTANGMSAKEIALRLGISNRTVEHHLRSSKEKLQCRSVGELIYKAMKSGLIACVCVSLINLEYGLAVNDTDFYGDLGRRAVRTRSQRKRDLDFI